CGVERVARLRAAVAGPHGPDRLALARPAEHDGRGPRPGWPEGQGTARLQRRQIDRSHARVEELGRREGEHVAVGVGQPAVARETRIDGIDLLTEIDLRRVLVPLDRWVALAPDE